MKCSACEEMIISALLTEIETVSCPHCQETVQVKDVLIYAEGFTFHRNDLTKRLFRYKNLLSEVTKEREMLEKTAQASDESKKSLDRFLQALEEVLAGARNNLRLDFSEQLPVRFIYGSKLQTGSLANLSMTGACVEIAQNVPRPRRKSTLTLSLTIPGLQGEHEIPAVVSWVNKSKHSDTAIGIEFKGLSQETIEALWDFISTAADAIASS